MARVELPYGIAAIHGRVGNMIFRSRKQADGTYRVFVHEAPARSAKNKGKNEPVSKQHRANYEPTTRDKGR